MSATLRWLCAIESYLIAGALLLASGCASSPPMRYYTLSDTATSTAPVVNTGAAPIKVGRISIPGEIDRTQLVNRLDANLLNISEMDRWAAPLDEMIRRVLTTNLASRVPASESGMGSVLTLDIHEFWADADCSITLRADWTLTAQNNQTLRRTDGIKAPPAGPCPSGLASGMSQAIGELSDHIASAIGQIGSR